MSKCCCLSVCLSAHDNTLLLVLLVLRYAVVQTMLTGCSSGFDKQVVFAAVTLVAAHGVTNQAVEFSFVGSSMQPAYIHTLDRSTHACIASEVSMANDCVSHECLDNNDRHRLTVSVVVWVLCCAVLD